jgi:hypothetical protein
MVRSMYLDYMNGYTFYLHKYISEMKVALIFLKIYDFLHRKVILAKDCLARIN